MSFNPELDGLSPRELLERLDNGPAPGDKWANPDYVSNWFIEVTYRLRRHECIGPMIDRLETADDKRAAAILFALGGSTIRKQEIQEILRRFFHDPRPRVLMETLYSMVRAGIKEPLDSILPLTSLEDVYVIIAALHYLRRFYPDKAVPLLRKALYSAHYLIRMSAVDDLEEMYDVESLPRFRELQQDPHEDVRQAADTAVENVEDYLERCREAGMEPVLFDRDYGVKRQRKG